LAVGGSDASLSRFMLFRAAWRAKNKRKSCPVERLFAVGFSGHGPTVRFRATKGPSTAAIAVKNPPSVKFRAHAATQQRSYTSTKTSLRRHIVAAVGSSVVLRHN
jgi:hypothetical protein